MRSCIYTIFLGYLLLCLPALAQLPSYTSPRPTVEATAALVCAKTHQARVARPAYARVDHRRKMARYDVSYYKLDLHLSHTSRSISGVVHLKARTLAQELDSLAFELHSNFVLDSVVVDGKRSTGWRWKGSGEVTVGLPQVVRPTALFNAFIYYHGTAPASTASTSGGGFNSMPDPIYGVHTTWSLSEPYKAYEWWPCKQVLTDKADSSDVWVSTAAANKVGSNGVLERVTSLPNNRVRYEWKSRHPIDYYLISVAVAPYVEYVQYAQPAAGPRIPIINYVYSQSALNALRLEMDRTPGFLEYFSELAGLYPFADEKYGHSMAPIGGGMEHQTMTTQSTFTFTLTAHELFHQWFGNNVTCGAWEDIWLNEGFASYGEYLALGRFSSTEAAQKWMQDAHYYAMNRYVNGQWVPMPGGSVFVTDTANSSRIFDYNLTYKKGASVVHMLRYELNDDTNFFQALRSYQQQYGGRTARTADLQRVFEAAAGRSLQYFFEQWFRGEGYPRFDVRWNQVGSVVYVSTLETASMPTITPFFNTNVDYLLTFTDGTTRTVRLHQYQPASTYALPESRTVASIQPDPEQWLLASPNGTVVRDNGLVTANRSTAPVPSLVVYPNPCRDQLRLGDIASNRVEAVVRDATGREVLRQIVYATSPVLVTASLAPGLYMLHLTDAAGRTSQARFVRASD